MHFDLEPKHYRVHNPRNKGRHGDVRVLVRSGVELQTPEVVKVVEHHEQATELRRKASQSEKNVAFGLSDLGFRHSVPKLGYFLDFFHDERRICIEIDGPHHRFRQAHDKKRDAALRANGIRVWRFRASWAYGDPTGLLCYVRKLIERIS